MLESQVLFIFQIVFFAFLFLVVLYIININRVALKEKRLNKYTVLPLLNRTISISSKLSTLYDKTMSRISKILNKSVLIVNYSNRVYTKHISFDEYTKIKAIDLFSKKIITALMFALILMVYYIISGEIIDFNAINLVMVVGFFFNDVFYIVKTRGRKKQLENDLLKSIIIINNAFKSGRTIMQAVEIVKNELDGPVQDEFKKIYLDLSYGLSIETVFTRFSTRVKLPEAEYIASSLIILSKTGGNIVKVFSSIERSLFNQKKVKAELVSLTGAAKFIVKLLLFIPLLFFVVIFALNPIYFKPFFYSGIGLIIFMIIIIIYIVYIFIINKVMKAGI